MKKANGWLTLLLIFAIATAIFYSFLSSIIKTSMSGVDGIAESIGYLIVWGAIFVYFGIRHATFGKPHSGLISLIAALALLGVVILGICIAAGIIS